MQNIIDFFRYLFKPTFWFSNASVDLEWDSILNKLLDEATDVRPGHHVSNIGGVAIWTSNYPYAYGSPYLQDLDILPKRRTRERLRKLIGDQEQIKIAKVLSGIKSNVTKMTVIN